jgi:hypothetical protein
MHATQQPLTICVPSPPTPRHSRDSTESHDELHSMSTRRHASLQPFWRLTYFGHGANARRVPEHSVDISTLALFFSLRKPTELQKDCESMHTKRSVVERSDPESRLRYHRILSGRARNHSATRRTIRTETVDLPARPFNMAQHSQLSPNAYLLMN